MKRRDILAAGAASLVAAPAWVGAQSPAWPTRGPVRLVAQFPPGGLVDTVSRLIAPHLSQALGGQTVLVENRAGAGCLET
jgi:tripartite-type tricarboxylate transporter receptor subunit TctC